MRQHFLSTAFVLGFFAPFISLPFANALPGETEVANYAQALFYYTTGPSIDRFSQVPSHAVGEAAQTSSEIAENPICGSFYQKLSSKGKVQIHVSFGYFDDSHGKPFIYGGTNFGNNASMDHAYFLILARVLTAPCRGKLALCGFKTSGDGVYQKTIMAADGHEVLYEIRSEDSSLTPFYDQNTGPLASEQNAKSAATRQAFLDALGSEDVVFYVGHSRNGGGPDFFPVRLMANDLPDYRGYYEQVRPGYHDLMTAVWKRGAAPPVLGLMSCYSEFWFGNALLKHSPQSGFIFTQSDLLSGLDEHFDSALASIDSLLRGQCFDGLKAELEAARKDPRLIENPRNFLTQHSPVDPHPHIPSVPD